MQGVEVGITQRGVETVGGVPGIRRQVEHTLEQEVQVGIGGDDSAVECLFAVGSRRREVGIIVAQRSQFADVQGIDAHLHVAASGEGGLQAALEA